MHLLGCGLFILPTIATAEEGFREANGIANDPVRLQYVYGIYWAAMVRVL
jgi:hypothetical protein